MADIHPNLVAYAALLIWPLVALCLYSRLPVAQATMWTILGGYLLLPFGTEIKLKMIPAFDKVSIPNLAALVGCALYALRRPRFFLGFGLAEAFIVVLIFGPFITSMLNGDAIVIGETVLPGVGPYDAGSAVIRSLIEILPFFLGRQFLRNSADSPDILRVLVIAGLFYSLPMLFELQMSPQLNRWIYGYTQFVWGDEVRGGGFRPQVFLTNGLLVAFFALTATVAAAALWRTKTRILRLAPGGITSYLTFVWLLCQSLGTLVYGAVLVPLVRWASPRLQLRIACVIVSIALAYPLLRVADLVPTTSTLEVTSAVSADRAASLKTRFDNEDQLVARAWERKWFGWGRYGRNRVHQGWLGGDSSITDGYWIIVLGMFGLVGFAATFGLFSLPVFRAAKALKFATAKEAPCLSAVALIVAINIFDCLPNASITSWSWLLAGALLGRAEALSVAARRRIPLGNLRPAQKRLIGLRA